MRLYDDELLRAAFPLVPGWRIAGALTNPSSAQPLMTRAARDDT
jgi:hypothetical protein